MSTKNYTSNDSACVELRHLQILDNLEDILVEQFYESLHTRKLGTMNQVAQGDLSTQQSDSFLFSQHHLLLANCNKLALNDSATIVPIIKSESTFCVKNYSCSFP